ncbi:MAG: thiol-disulfide isomerase [Actinobacteria bacterium]|nr:thiol-disulfide isomerase [Actinomycetota bacterium]
MQSWWLASYVVLWVLVVALCVVVVALARQIGTLHLRLGPRGALEIDSEGPPIGEAAGPLELAAIDDRRVTIGRRGEAELLMFVSPGCHVCEQVLPSVDAVASAGRLAPYVLTDVDKEETALAFGGRDLRAPVVPGLEAAQRYEVPGTPYVIVLDDYGVVRAKGTVNNLEQVEGLVDAARRRTNGHPPHGRSTEVS